MKRKINHKFKMLTIFFVVSIFLYIGCSSRLNKIYDYKPLSYSFDNLFVQAKLIGSFISSKKETVKGSPYNLLIVFESNDKIDKSILIMKVELHNVESQKIVYKKNMIHEKKFEVDSDGKYRVYLSHKNIDLKYIPYMLVLEFKIKKHDSIVEEKIKLYFDKDYKEYNSNDFWDSLMSV